MLGILLALAVAGTGLLFARGYERPQYEDVDITFSLIFPPFDEFTLSTKEVDELVCALSSMDFPGHESTDGPVFGGTVACTITTTEGERKVNFLDPYLAIDGTLYKFDPDEEIFRIEDRILRNHCPQYVSRFEIGANGGMVMEEKVDANN